MITEIMYVKCLEYSSIIGFHEICQFTLNSRGRKLDLGMFGNNGLEDQCKLGKLFVSFLQIGVQGPE